MLYQFTNLSINQQRECAKNVSKMYFLQRLTNRIVNYVNFIALYTNSSCNTRCVLLAILVSSKYIPKKNSKCHTLSLIYILRTMYVVVSSFCVCVCVRCLAKHVNTYTHTQNTHLKSHYLNAMLSNNRF